LAIVDKTISLFAESRRANRNISRYLIVCATLSQRKRDSFSTIC